MMDSDRVVCPICEYAMQDGGAYNWCGRCGTLIDDEMTVPAFAVGMMRLRQAVLDVPNVRQQWEALKSALRVAGVEIPGERLDAADREG